MEIFISAARYYRTLKTQGNKEQVRNLVRAELDLELFLLKLKSELETLNSQLEELADSMEPTLEPMDEEDEKDEE